VFQTFIDLSVDERWNGRRDYRSRVLNKIQVNNKFTFYDIQNVDRSDHALMATSKSITVAKKQLCPAIRFVIALPPLGFSRPSALLLRPTIFFPKEST